MLAQDLEVFKSTRQLVSIMLGYTRNISREVKYAEWADARGLANRALDLIFLINSETDYMRRVQLTQTYLSYLYGVQNRTRLLAESGYIGIKFRNEVLIKLEECMKQGTAMRNYYAKRARIKEAMPN